MPKKKLSLDDIFNDDDFGLLDSKAKSSNVKSEEDRLIDTFEEINSFYDKNKREPSTTSMSEYGLLAKLKNFRQNEDQKIILKPFDRHNLLGYVEIEKTTLDDVLNEIDDLDILDTEDELSIFKFNHTPKPEERAETDFVARRKALSEKEFAPYEAMFHKVNKELKEGKRKLLEFKDVEKHLKEGYFYIADGVMLFLEKVTFERYNDRLSKNTTRRKDGRTRIIFENGTGSNMYYRSLGKAIYNNGKMISNTNENSVNEFYTNTKLLENEDINTGWIYVLKTKSTKPELSAIKNLHKIGFASTSVDERIKNAKNEATYLFADVQKVATYKCYNRNADKLENLLHRFFANACLNIDLFDNKGQRLSPREWFVVPFEVIEEAINLILNENIVNYEYDTRNKKIIIKKQ